MGSISFSACAPVHPAGRPSFQAMVLKLHIRIPHGKIADLYFFELSALVDERPIGKKSG